MTMVILYALTIILLFAVIGYLTSKPKHLTVRRGSNVTFTCSSDTHEVQWGFIPAYDSRAPRLIPAMDSQYDRHIYVDNNGTLYLYSVSEDDAGVYRCEDRDEAAFAELQVLGK